MRKEQALHDCQNTLYQVVKSGNGSVSVVPGVMPLTTTTAAQCPEGEKRILMQCIVQDSRTMDCRHQPPWRPLIEQRFINGATLEEPSSSCSLLGCHVQSVPAKQHLPAKHELC